MSTDETTPGLWWYGARGSSARGRITRGVEDVLADMRDVVKVERPDDAVRVPVSDLALILSHLAARDAEVAERIAQAIEAMPAELSTDDNLEPDGLVWRSHAARIARGGTSMSTLHERARAGCEHCPDGHADPESRPWGVFVASERDGDGQPTHLYVAPTAGQHVAESDAEWVRARLNEAASRPRQVTTVAELDALPVGSVVLDRHGEAWRKTRTDDWTATALVRTTSSGVPLPARVLHVPEEES